MNRIYQVVWSKAKNCYTVVSEIAKRHGKGNRARTCAAAFLAALALTSVMGMSEAQAQTIDADGISNGDARIALNGAAGMVGMVNGKDASIFMYGGNTTINKKVTIDQTGKITGVVAGAVTAGSTDAVNGGQLHAVAAEASKHSKVVNGSNINVEESEVNGQKIYKVGLNDDVRLGTIETTGYIATKDRIIADKGAQLAGINVSGNIISNGAARIALYGDSGVAGMMNGKGASIYMQDGNTVINRKVNIDKDGKVTATAGEIGNVVLQNGKVTAAAGEIGGVTIKEGNITGVNAINTSAINTNTLNAKYNLSVGTANENGTMPFFVNSNGAFYAANGKLVVDKDGNVTAGNVVLKNGVFTGRSALRDGELLVGDASGSYSQITPNSAKLGKVTIDEKGNIAGANSIQTNALNAKYNLSVGTANENGTMPFFVNSNGAFYAANNNFSVGKDGKVTATAGKIGGVTINEGISYKNTSLRDGFLFVGDDKGNYSQISPEYAKLGKVTIDKEGNVTGVKSINTNAINANAINAKYNLSVGTANENGTMPFFVNSNGAFYAANGKLVVDKDGNVTAGNVVLKNGVFTGRSALRDGELLVGDASGSYSQITPKSAKLGKVTIDENGKIAGVNSIQTNALNAKYNLSVGTANGNGTMPFFVNSNGAFYAANGKLVVDKDGKVTATAGKIGNVVLNNGVFTGNSKLRDGELLVGDASGNYSQITTKGAKLGKVTVAEDGKITGVAAGAITADSTDAVNGSQLHAVATEAAKHSKVVNGSNINVEEAELNGQKIYKVGLNDDVRLGTIETTGYIATKDRIIADKGAQLAGINVSGNIISNGAARIALYGDSGVAGMMNGKGASIYMQDGNTVINKKVAIDQNGKITGVAAGKADTDAVNVGQLKIAVADAVKDAAKASDVGNIGDIHKELQNKDGSKTTVVDAVNNLDNKVGDLKYSAVTKGDIKDGDSSTTAIGKLNQKLSGVAAVAGQHSSVSTTDANIKIQEGTNAAGGKDYQLSLNPDQKLHSVTTGETKMDTNGISINGKTYVSKDGLNANGNKVTQVADGKLEKDSKDAVNGGQLYATNQRVEDNASNISLLGNSINKLDNRVDKVGAGAAALAALHPLDFDPEDKWDFAAGYGNYSGASAVALGAYYRPNEDTMFSVGGSFGNGENMVNAGVSLKLGQSNRAPASKAAMEKKISALSQEVEELKAAIADLRAAQTKAKDATEKDAQKK